MRIVTDIYQYLYDMMRSDVVLNENSILLIIKRYLGFLLITENFMNQNEIINAKFIFSDISVL